MCGFGSKYVFIYHMKMCNVHGTCIIIAFFLTSYTKYNFPILLWILQGVSIGVFVFLPIRLFPPSPKNVKAERRGLQFLVADTRRYTLPCRSVCRSISRIYELRAVFALLLLPNRPRLDCRVSGLVDVKFAKKVTSEHYRPCLFASDFSLLIDGVFVLVN